MKTEFRHRDSSAATHTQKPWSSFRGREGSTPDTKSPVRLSLCAVRIPVYAARGTDDAVVPDCQIPHLPASPAPQTTFGSAEHSPAPSILLAKQNVYLVGSRMMIRNATRPHQRVGSACFAETMAAGWEQMRDAGSIIIFLPPRRGASILRRECFCIFLNASGAA